jgi:HEAT repeat protein
MRLSKILTLFALTLFLGTAWSAPPDLKGKTLKQMFDDLLPNLSKTEAQQQWQNICTQLGAPGNEALRQEAGKLMAEKLDAKTPNAARLWLLKQLERIGREECVDAVAVVLDDKDEQVRDAAVRCLANNPAAPATAALLAKLPGATGKAKVGLLHGLGHRQDKTAVDAVAKELTSPEPAVAIAAARVLGKFATPEAAARLAAARSKAQGEVRLAIGDAYLECADRRLKEGKTGDAAAIYKELNKPEEERPIRLAALQGVLRSAGDPAGTMILDILGGTDVDARAIAIGQIEHVSAGALKSLATNIDKLPVASQVQVLTAFAARGDKAQLPVALAAAKNTNDALKRAGIQALGRLGDASVVGLLLETMFAGGNLGSAAADSLAQLAADGVTEKVTAALDAEKMPARVAALIGILERRRATEAVPALLKAARSDDPAVRTSAFAGLKNLADPKDIPELVLALPKTAKGKERDQAEQAIVVVCLQVAEPEKRVEPVLMVLSSGKAPKADLLPLLGRLGGPKALPLMKEALAAGSSEMVEAGVAGLCNWPDRSASDDLLKLAQEAKEANHRLLALQAVIRVNTLPTDPPSHQQRLAAFQAAMKLATRNEERQKVLEGIGFVRILDTLHYVLPYLDDKELNQAACKAVVELAHSKPLRDPNKAEFDKALDRVIALCKDKGLVDRARQYKLGQ